MIKFGIKEVLAIYDLVMQTSGGRKGIRDYGLLDSAINSAYHTFDDIELYPTIEEKASRIGYSLISNHAFTDGNKRTSMLVMLTFLETNGINLKYTDEELINLGMSLGEGKAKYDDLLNWINAHEEKIIKNDAERSK